jgi:hypothetical protein
MAHSKYVEEIGCSPDEVLPFMDTAAEGYANDSLVSNPPDLDLQIAQHDGLSVPNSHDRYHFDVNKNQVRSNFSMNVTI